MTCESCERFHLDCRECIKELKMSPYKSALLIQRYAEEAVEGLRTRGATADTEHRLIDIGALARDIANDVQPSPHDGLDPRTIVQPG